MRLAFSIGLLFLAVAPAALGAPRTWSVRCLVPYALVGDPESQKELVITEYLSSYHPAGSLLGDSLSLEPAERSDSTLGAEPRPALPKNFALSQIADKETRARILTAPFDPLVDYQRLVHPRDWARGQKEHPDAPWKVYDLKTMNDWRLAEEFVRKNADDMELGPGLLKKIHSITARHLFFFSYEARRIKLAYKRGTLSFGQARQALLDLEEGKAYTSKPHSELAGTFRTERPDFLVNFGDQRVGANRFFTPEQIARYKQNPYFHVAAWTRESVGNDGVRLPITLVPPAEVESAVSAAYDRAKRDIAASQTDEQYLAAVLKLEQALISIHPFIDGNGRSIRLQSDLLLRRRGIPPPLHPKDGDFTATPEELYETAVQGVRDYVRAKNR
jgi:hypothetical protein